MKQMSLALFITIFLLLTIANVFFKIQPTNHDLALLIFLGVLSIDK